MISYDKCPLTGTANIKKIFEVRDYTVSNKKFSIWQNNELDFRFTNPVPDENEIKNYYQSEDYISHSEIKKGLINRLYLLARKWTVSSKKRLTNQLNKKKGYLLDVGCGAGFFLNHMKENGWKCSGIEADKRSRNQTIERYGLQIIAPSAISELESGKYNVITLWHVLEHIHELHSSMKEYFRLLAPGGRLILALPNYRSYDAEFYNENWAAYDVPRHLYHFTPEAVKNLLEKHNFKPELKKLMPLDAFYVSMLSEKYRNGSMLRAIFIGFLSFLKSVFNTDRSSSVIYIAKKI